MASSPPPPPLTLSLSLLRPHTLFSAPLSPPSSLPAAALPLPTPPPDVLSPTHNYPGSPGSMCLGAALAAHLRLGNTSGAPVRGVRMMCEVQGPGGRYQLGEAVHGTGEGDGEGKQVAAADGLVNTTEPGGEEEVAPPATEPVAASSGEESLPELGPGQVVSLDCETEVKETGLHILICSVAWETPDGRRTFQRFLKFNVSPPLAIKTRIVAPSSANSLLDPARREEIYLEILTTNTSPEGIQFERVGLEAVSGLQSRSIAGPASDSTPGPSRRPSVVVGGDKEPTLMPGDTRQYLFLLTPSPAPPTSRRGSKADQPTPSLPRSILPPTHPAGTILPLGRLDVAWLSGPYHDPGRLQTSTLNRRVPVGAPSSVRPPPGPTRTTSALPPSPAQTPSVRATSPRPPLVPSKGDDRTWEFDLVVLRAQRSAITLESEFSVTLRVAARSLETAFEGQSAPTPPLLGLQHLGPPPPAPSAISGLTPNLQLLSPGLQLTPPDLVLSPPSRGSTPYSPPASYPSTPTGGGGGASRTLSPAVDVSRPRTPLAAQLKQVANSGAGALTAASAVPDVQVTAVDFPPLPYLIRQTKGSDASQSAVRGEAALLGSTLNLLPLLELSKVEENQGVVYGEMPPPRTLWEGQAEAELRFIALEEGLAELGGVRILVLKDETGIAGHVEREWESLGDVWITA